MNSCVKTSAASRKLSADIRRLLPSKILRQRDNVNGLALLNTQAANIIKRFLRIPSCRMLQKKKTTTTTTTTFKRKSCLEISFINFRRKAGLKKHTQREKGLRKPFSHTTCCLNKSVVSLKFYSGFDRQKNYFISGFVIS